MYEGSIITERGERRIFEGEVLGAGRSRVRGFHLEDEAVMVARGIVVVERSRSASDSRGVYRVQVAMQGNMRNGSYDVMFPRGWTRDQVRQAIAEAHATREAAPRGGLYKGRTRSGMVIRMELDESGGVVDAWPVRAGKGLSNRRRDARFRVERGAIKKHREVCGQCHALKVPVCPNGHHTPFEVLRWYYQLRALLGRILDGVFADVVRVIRHR